MFPPRGRLTGRSPSAGDRPRHVRPAQPATHRAAVADTAGDEFQAAADRGLHIRWIGRRHDDLAPAAATNSASAGVALPHHDDHSLDVALPPGIEHVPNHGFARHARSAAWAGPFARCGRPRGRWQTHAVSWGYPPRSAGQRRHRDGHLCLQGLNPRKPLNVRSRARKSTSSGWP